jgi:hypothetical protein
LLSHIRNRGRSSPSMSMTGSRGWEISCAGLAGPAIPCEDQPSLTCCERRPHDRDRKAIITLNEAGVYVQDLYVPGRDIAAHLTRIPGADREKELVQAIEVGIFCLERAQNSRDTAVVKREIDALLAQVAAVPAAVERELLGKIGTGEGQALKPVRDLVNEVEEIMEARVNEVKEILEKDLDPDKASSVLGRALTQIRNVLDPSRKDSLQGAFTDALASVTGEDGALLKAVKVVVSETIEPLADEVDALAKEIRGHSAAAEVIQRTTEKGRPYEDEVVVALQEWAWAVGAEIHHVGPDRQPGHVLVVFPSDLGDNRASASWSRCATVSLRWSVENRCPTR